MRLFRWYRKSTMTALVGGVLTWAGVAWVPDGNITRPEWFALAVALATAAGVHGVASGDAAPGRSVVASISDL